MVASELLKQKRILFMGTPEFSVVALKRLYEEKCNIVGVVTTEDKPFGRGYELKEPAVKTAAKEMGLEVFQPEKLKKIMFQETLEKLDPEIILVVAFGKLLPPYVINYPKYGCINLHGSLLPKYRGAAPMQRVIMDGEKETGITVMKMDNGLDTGDMVYKLKCDILEDDNFENIHDKLAALSADAMIEGLNQIVDGTAVYEKQDDSLSCYAEKIENTECKLDFSLTVDELYNKIRGLSPFPLTYCFLNGKRIKFISAGKENKQVNNCNYGQVLSLENGEISVACKDGIIKIKTLQQEGKRRMNAVDFINGRGVKVGDIFE